MIEVGLKCVMREPLTGRCMILLESVSGLEVLPIPVGEESANTIHSFLCGKNTDDLGIFGITAGIISSLDNAFPERVVIDGYEDGVFTSKVYIIVNGEERAVDARPSDAVRFALLSKVPVYVAKRILFEKFRDKKLCFERKSDCCK
ncbi:bifunctional nuclease family protein [Geovibrio thiophilus]|uniref:Bifunctional nuclease family protein n=1 Tax=Geovibrio thiophilus TaxID=139438 RepID=A0A3R5X3A4_9BACT|nr:bifunctional nuclease domain-containing protein [Geovibrio thiophilus]QAR33522.1 bifunctional nuclease family protein [Geovibrio thiophilus]